MQTGRREQRGREDVVDMAGTEKPVEQLLAVPSNTKQEGQTFHQCVVPHFDWTSADCRVDCQGDGF